MDRLSCLLTGYDWKQLYLPFWKGERILHRVMWYLLMILVFFMKAGIFYFYYLGEDQDEGEYFIRRSRSANAGTL